MEIKKLSPNIGAEVTGIDLRGPLDEATKQELVRAAVDNVCMVIRDQDFTPADFREACLIFGEVMDLDHPKYGFPDVPGIKRHSNFNLDANGERLKDGKNWHTDGAFRERPPRFTILYAVEIPDTGGDTLIMNMRAAYQSLPDDERARLAELKTANVRQSSVSQFTTSVNNANIMAQGDQVANIHPLVRTNADNGEVGLWFDPARCEYIVGMNPEDSQDLLRDLMERLIKPEFTYAHKWRLGDMFLWDNRQSMHKATFEYDWNQHRLMYNASTLGERPY